MGKASKPASAKDLQRYAGDAAALLKALANEQRLSILCSLLEGPLSVGQINDRVDLSQSALSQHLAVLREGGWVQTEKQAQTVYYSVPIGPVHKMLDTLKGIYCPR
jgi:ArsR family transcriptional regulator, virulence genes transcriptional regulator